MGIKLGNICRFQSGGTPSKGKTEFFNGTIPWITTTALNGGNIGKESAVDWISEQAIKESAAKIVPAFSIMVGTRVGVGKVAINTMSMSTSQDIISLLDIDESMWSKAFLCKFLQAKGTFLNAQARGATIKGIKIDVLSELELPKIPIEEQQHISQIIDKVKTTIAIRQRQLQKLDELVKARFVEMFGDSVKNSKRLPTVLGETLFRLSNGKALPSNERFPEGIPAYGGNGVSWYTDKILCDFDTIIVGRVGFQSGNVRLAKAPLWVTDNAMYISSLNTEICDMRFLCALMEHIDFTRYQDAGDLKKITQKPFMQMHYPMPSMQAQMQYIDFSNQTDKSKVAVQKALDEAQLLFDSLMQKYFG